MTGLCPPKHCHARLGWHFAHGRDLIASADTILNMARTCEAVLGNVKTVQVRWCLKPTTLAC